MNMYEALAMAKNDCKKVSNINFSNFLHVVYKKDRYYWSDETVFCPTHISNTDQSNNWYIFDEGTLDQLVLRAKEILNKIEEKVNLKC